jgi:hypothetical protein
MGFLYLILNWIYLLVIKETSQIISELSYNCKMNIKAQVQIHEASNSLIFVWILIAKIKNIWLIFILLEYLGNVRKSIENIYK